MFDRFRRFFPDLITIDARERARSVLGALLGIFITGLVCSVVPVSDAALPWLVGPMGASAVLLFAAPASPLAQPWPVLCGNVLSALIGIACVKFIGAPLAAACVAVGAAIAAMFALRCLHPPGGAVALGVALADPSMAGLGYGYALFPVGLNSLVLLLTAIAYNRLCNRRYPHLAADHRNPHRTADALPTERLGLTPEDLDAALRQYNQILDISRDDLEEVLVRAQVHAYHRRFGEVTCSDIMSRDVVTVEFGTSLRDTWRLLRKHKVEALPVTNRFRHVIGMVSLQDFIRHCDIGDSGFRSRLRGFFGAAPRPDAEQPEVAGQIMTKEVPTADGNQPIASLVPLFSDGDLQCLPVVDGSRKLLGIVTQSDLVAALYAAQLEQATSASKKRA